MNSLFHAGGMTQSDRRLHTPGSFAKQNLLYVQEVGYLKSLKPHKCVRENLDSYLFLVVLEGKGSLDIKGKHYDIIKGDCAFIDCMEHYEHISDEKEAWKLAWVHFNGITARGYYELFIKYNMNENVFATNDCGLWDKLIGNLLDRQMDRGIEAELACGEMLLHLINTIIYSVSAADVLVGEQERLIVDELRERLNVMYADVGVLQSLEKSFGESVEELGEKFYQKYGIRLEEYISSRRLNAAKELLRFSIKPIDTIAVESGIGDILAMQQMFQENEGMSAEEYRAKWAQWIR